MKPSREAALGRHGPEGGRRPYQRVAPVNVPLSEIDLGSWDFWGLDDIRAGAIDTFRCEAPVGFHESMVGDRAPR